MLQLTHGQYGHTLNYNQVFSPDGAWIVYDTRNQDQDIARTKRIERVHIPSQQIELLYQIDTASDWGPGVGAAAYNPKVERVSFIHGLSTASEQEPYAMDRRTGVYVDTALPGKIKPLDARQVIPPFKAGALRGGTHAHAWSADGTKLCFTYNDEIIRKLSETSEEIQDLRTVGVMIPQPVQTHVQDGNNFSGTMFAEVIVDVTDQPKAGSDEILRAFDECWLGNATVQQQQSRIAFQGICLDAHLNEQRDIFIAYLPDDITKAKAGYPLEGTFISRPNTAQGLRVQRLTKGIQISSTPRHWLRSSEDGQYIYFLKSDQAGFVNIFSWHIQTEKCKQLTFHKESIVNQFNIYQHEMVYPLADALYILDLKTLHSRRITPLISAAEGALEGAPNWSPNGNLIAFNRRIKSSTGDFLQIFIIERSDFQA